MADQTDDTTVSWEMSLARILNAVDPIVDAWDELRSPTLAQFEALQKAMHAYRRRHRVGF